MSEKQKFVPTTSAAAMSRQEAKPLADAPSIDTTKPTMGPTYDNSAYLAAAKLASHILAKDPANFIENVDKDPQYQQLIEHAAFFDRLAESVITTPTSTMRCFLDSATSLASKTETSKK